MYAQPHKAFVLAEICRSDELESSASGLRLPRISAGSSAGAEEAALAKSVIMVSPPPACSDNECVRLCDLLIVCAVLQEPQKLSDRQLLVAAGTGCATVDSAGA